MESPGRTQEALETLKRRASLIPGSDGKVPLPPPDNLFITQE